MLTLECPCCGVMADETELAPGYEAHLKRFGPDASPEEIYLWRFKERQSIDGSVAAGVAQ